MMTWSFGLSLGSILLLSLQDSHLFVFFSFTLFGHITFGQQIVSFVMKTLGTGIAILRLDGLASSLWLLG
jgi:hypothetical protein